MSYAIREGIWSYCKDLNCIMCRHHFILSRTEEASLHVLIHRDAVRGESQGLRSTFVHPHGHRTQEPGIISATVFPITLYWFCYVYLKQTT